MLDTGRARAFVQGLEEFLGQGQVSLHPTFAGGMGQVQVQPEKRLAIVRLLQGLQGLGRIQFATPLAGAERKAVEQAEQIRIAMGMVDAVVHGGSQEGRHL